MKRHRKSLSPRPRSTGTWRGPRWSPGFLRGLLALTGWCGTLAAAGWGLHAAAQSARQARADVAGSLEWAELPSWLRSTDNARVLGQIESAIDLPERIDLHHPQLCEFVGRKLLDTGWVANVDRVTRLPDGRIRVHAQFREPFAYVQAAGVAYLVDRDGVRLPIRCQVDQTQERCWQEWYRITGMAAAVPPVGRPWPGDDLAAGLHLIQYLTDAAARGEVPFRSSLRTINVANFGRRRNPADAQLRIGLVYPNSYIAWGLPPGAEYPVEPSAQRKIDMLRACYVEHGGRFPDGRIVEVRNEKGYDLPVSRGRFE